MGTKLHISLSIPADHAGLRLDKALSSLLPDYSRSLLKSWIDSHAITLNEQPTQARTKVYGGERIDLNTEVKEQTQWAAEDLPVNIVFEDDDIIVINKPADCVVHPGAGNQDGTLVNALLHHCPTLTDLPRAGLIHRIDKDTTGLLVIAKTLKAHTHLTQALQAREIKREYQALVYGNVFRRGTIEGDMGRDPRNRLRMALVASGKPATTHYQIAKHYDHFTLLNVTLETGRTHQIRVHLKSISHPIVGDQTYHHLQLPPKCPDELKRALTDFKRQALHAIRLTLTHPCSDERLSWEVPLPEDFKCLLNTVDLAQTKYET